MDYNRSNGVGALTVAANISAVGAIVGRRLGLSAAPGVAANVFTFALDPAAGYNGSRTNVKATIQGAVGGVARVFNPTPTTLSVATYTSAGASTALPFSLGVRSRVPSRFVRGPLGNTVVSALYDMVGIVPTAVGPDRGVASVLRTGAGVFELTLSAECQIDPLNALVTVTPAQTIAEPLDSFVSFEHVSDTLVRVRTFDAGTPADRNFYVTVERIGLG